MSKMCERENFGKEDEGALTREDSPKLQRRETGDFGGGTPSAAAPYSRTAAGHTAASCVGNRAISQVFLSDFWVFRFFHPRHKSIF